MMGIVMNKEVREASKRNKLIENEMRKNQNELLSTIKMLLLGAGESGKSTILKQMKILHSNGFSDEEYRRQKGVVFANTVQSMAAILKAMDYLQIKFDDPEMEIYSKTVMQTIRNQEESQPFAPELTKALKYLWSDNSVQVCFKRNSEYQLNDSAKYFLDDIDRLSRDDYLPTQDDMLRARVKTTGIVEVDFTLKGLIFRVFDVGGQRSERKKWIHCFDDVNAILFVTSLSEYDQKLFEDEATNRMHESLRLFDSICNSQWFQKSSILLFLNKKDLFEEKIKINPITIAFPNYKGGDSYEETTAYIQRQFERFNKNEKKTVYSHYTCATDTSQVKFVLDSAIDMIINENLQQIGLT